MKKILYIVNSSHPQKVSSGVSSFNVAAYKAAIKNDFDFHVNVGSIESLKISHDSSIKLHLVQIYRNPFSRGVIVAYKQLMQLLKEEHFDIIHCNTPIGGFLGRVCGGKAKVPKIIYQAHGFHFYKGAPLINWILYYPIEKWLAHYTDVLITINKEDYTLAKSKFHLRNNGQVYYVPGVGIDLSSFRVSTEVRNAKREELRLDGQDIVLISAGRLDKNKNNEITLKALARIPNAKLLLCGDGVEEENLKTLAKTLKIDKRVLFLGNRTDIKDLYQAADVFILSSFREGLSRSIMEAMASGLPCVVSNIRGNVDLIDEGEGGYLFPPIDIEYLANKINELVSSKYTREKFSLYNIDKIKKFSMLKVIDELISIYKNVTIGITN